MHRLLKSMYIQRVSAYNAETRCVLLRDCDTCFMIMAHGEMNIKINLVSCHLVLLHLISYNICSKFFYSGCK
jgi:hypothetical protein